MINQQMTPFVNGQKNTTFVNPSLISNNVFYTGNSAVHKLPLAQHIPPSTNDNKGTLRPPDHPNKSQLIQKYRNKSQIHTRNTSIIQTQNNSQINSQINSRAHSPRQHKTLNNNNNNYDHYAKQPMHLDKTLSYDQAKTHFNINKPHLMPVPTHNQQQQQQQQEIDDHCIECVNKEIIAHHQKEQQQQKEADLELKRRMDDHRLMDQQMQQVEQEVKRDRAKYLQDQLVQQMQSKQWEIQQQQQKEQSLQLLPITQECFDNQEKILYHNHIQEHFNQQELQQQIRDRQLQRQQERAEQLQMENTGLDIDAQFVNKFIPTTHQYTETIRKQIHDNSILKIRQLNQQKQQELKHTNEITQFFNQEQQRIKEYQEKKKQKYNQDITQDIYTRQQAKQRQKHEALVQEQQENIIHQQHHEAIISQQKQDAINKVLNNKQSIEQQLILKKERLAQEKHQDKQLEQDLLKNLKYNDKPDEKVDCKCCNKKVLKNTTMKPKRNSIVPKPLKF